MFIKIYSSFIVIDKTFNQKANKELKRLVNNKDGLSRRKLACRFQCTQQYVSKVIKDIGINNYKNQKFRTEPMNKNQLIGQNVQRSTVKPEQRVRDG